MCVVETPSEQPCSRKFDMRALIISNDTRPRTIEQVKPNKWLCKPFILEQNLDVAIERPYR